MFYSKNDNKYEKRKKDWDEIEKAVFEYQKQFKDPQVSEEQLRKSKEAGEFIIEKFQPLVNKYLILLTTGQINWNDSEMKLFVSKFGGGFSL